MTVRLSGIEHLFDRSRSIESFTFRLSKPCAEWGFQNPLFDRLFRVVQG